MSPLAPSVRASRPAEAFLLAVLVVDLFLILCGYYLLKAVREGLILSSGGMLGLRGDELKLYATGAMALLLVGVVPLYAAVASRVSRIRLIRGSYLTVLVSLCIFFAAGRAGLPVGLVFYLWLGIVNVFLVGQFWSFVADLCPSRRFAVIGIGGAAGAIAGPRIALLADTWSAMAIAAGLLAGCLALFHVAERLGRGTAPAGEPLAPGGGFAMVRRDRYLLLIAALLVLANLVNTIGEYILSRAALEHAASAATDDARREMIKDYYGAFYGWVNLVGFLLQTLVVSRLMKLSGGRTALFVLPVIALAGYGAIGLAGGLALVRVSKIVENATDYSIQNTARQALFVPTSREAKYKAKAAIDTFFVRGGDLLAAIAVAVAVRGLHLAPASLALVNAGLALAWIAVAVAVARRHRELAP